MLVNLLNNALHATKDTPGGYVELHCQQVEQHLEIMVQDNGHGIESAHLPRIFEPLFTTKPIGQGTGLGLSVSHNFVKEHHGELKVESEIGKGTKFCIQLPLL